MGVSKVHLTERSLPEEPAQPPPEVRLAIDGIRSLLEGRWADLSQVRLDLGGLPSFHQRVYEAARAIPAGSTVTYGELAARIGSPGASRAVGQALGRNPFLLVVPCHRILAANGKLGGFSSPGGTGTKLRLLRLEQAMAAESGQGLAYDPDEAIRALSRADSVLGRLIEEAGPFSLRPDPKESLFDSLARAIVGQQLSGTAARTIFSRLCCLFPNPHLGLDPRRILRTSEERLRGAGLSGAKLLALRDLAARTVDGRLPTLEELESMDDEAIVDALTQVRGIGRWTAQMLLLFRLGRPDVFPVDDLGVRKGYSLAFGREGLPTPTELLAAGERWAPYRSVASWYLWRAVDLAK